MRKTGPSGLAPHFSGHRRRPQKIGELPEGTLGVFARIARMAALPRVGAAPVATAKSKQYPSAAAALDGLVADGQTLAAVSYTHLDVYKRQMCNSAGFVLC